MKKTEFFVKFTHAVEGKALVQTVEASFNFNFAQTAAKKQNKSKGKEMQAKVLASFINPTIQISKKMAIASGLFHNSATEVTVHVKKSRQNLMEFITVQLTEPKNPSCLQVYQYAIDEKKIIKQWAKNGYPILWK